MSADTLHTTSDVIDALGGTKAVAAMMGRTDPAVSNWRKLGMFPAHTYRAIQNALAEQKRSAPDSLWNMSGRS